MPTHIRTNKKYGKVIFPLILFVTSATFAISISLQATSKELRKTSKFDSIKKSSVSLENTPQRSSKKEIESWQLFGPLIKPEELTSNLKESKLKIELLGTFINNDDRFSSAIISIENLTPTLAKKKSLIMPKVSIEEIYLDKIVIESSGTLEIVSLSDNPGPQITQRNEINNKPKNKKEVKNKEEKTPREITLEKYGLEPVSSTEAEGYIITENAKEIIEKFGLSPGDIVVSVNGYPIGDNYSDTLATKSFQDSGAASVVVNKSGEMVTMEYKR